MKKGINFNQLNENSLISFSESSTDSKAAIMSKLLKNVKYKFLLPLLFTINPEDEKIKVYSNRKNIEYILKELQMLLADLVEWATCDDFVEVELYVRKKEQLIKERQRLLNECLDNMESRKRQKKEKEIVIQGDVSKAIEKAEKKLKKKIVKNEEVEAKEIEENEEAEEAEEVEDIVEVEEEDEFDHLDGLEPSDEELEEIEKENK